MFDDKPTKCGMCGAPVYDGDFYCIDCKNQWKESNRESRMMEMEEEISRLKEMVTELREELMEKKRADNGY